MIAGQVLPAQSASYPRMVLSKPSRLSALVAFTVGCSTSIAVQWIGILYVSELILIVIASGAILTRQRALRERHLLIMLVVLSISFLGYVVSDLLIGTAPNEVMRGWARTLFLATNIIGFYALCKRRPMNLLAFCVGFSVGAIAVHQIDGTVISDWKFGPGSGVALLVAGLTPVLGTKIGIKLTAALLLALGVANMFLDFRSLSTACLLVSVLLFTRILSPRTNTKSVIVLLVFLGVGVGVWGYLYTSTDNEFFQRRVDSNAERTAGLFTAWNAISDSPWIGHGSWAVSSELQSSYESLYRERSGHRNWGSTNPGLTAHSELFQAWFEGGVLGLAFFLYFGTQLVKALIYCAFTRPLDKSSPLLLFYLLTSLWDVLFSPFAGGQRISIAFACTIVFVMEDQKKLVMPVYSKLASGRRKRMLIRMPAFRGSNPGY